MGGLLEINKEVRSFEEFIYDMPPGEVDLKIRSGFLLIRVEEYSTSTLLYLLDTPSGGSSGGMAIRESSKLSFITEDSAKTLSLVYKTATNSWHLINNENNNVYIRYAIIKI